MRARARPCAAALPSSRTSNHVVHWAMVRSAAHCHSVHSSHVRGSFCTTTTLLYGFALFKRPSQPRAAPSLSSQAQHHTHRPSITARAGRCQARAGAALPSRPLHQLVYRLRCTTLVCTETIVYNTVYHPSGVFVSTSRQPPGLLTYLLTPGSG